MADKRDYYEVIGIERSASVEIIKRAYRKGALKYHPDSYRGDKQEGETKFKELTEAYEVLSDPTNRQRYDQFGHAGLQGGAGMHDFSNMGFSDIFSMFQDILSGSGFSGGQAGGGYANRGTDLETEVNLSFEQVAAGAEQTLEFSRMDLCKVCSGSGSKPGEKSETCRKCNGQGTIHQQVAGFFGYSVRSAPCPDCRGRGIVITNPCEDCSGSGREKIKRTLSVHIPAGVRHGQVVRVRGEGEPSVSGTEKGDLHVYVNVKEHPFLERRGNELLCLVPITFSVAALGGTVQVPTLEGAEDMEIPKGTQSADVITMKKRGLPDIATGRKGSQHVQVIIEVPKKVSKEQRELLEKFAETEHAHITPQRKGFLEKLKEYFS